MLDRGTTFNATHSGHAEDCITLDPDSDGRGLVPDPGKTFLSSTEYLEHHRHKANYSDDFFSGRIAEEDSDVAAMTSSIEIGDARARISRGVFTPSGHREFTRYSTPSGEVHTTDSDEDGTTIEREFQR